MKEPVKPYHYILPAITMIVALGIMVIYGRVAFGVITGKQGIAYDYYMYKGITEEQYAAYNLAVALLAAVYTGLQLVYLFGKNHPKINKTYWLFLFLAIVIIIGELILNWLYVPKG